MSGTHIALAGLGKRFGNTTAVDALTTDLLPGAFAALLGPSGCGKSTTLAMIAGLIDPDAGDIRFDGLSILTVAAERRPVGLVFQKPLLFPHLNVADNVAFGLRMRRLDRAATRRRVDTMLERVQLADLAHRRVGELSGGQEQRVALARALVLEPQVLLLDEPFSQLDATLRAEMRTLLRQLHDESDVTTVFVTHDQAEAVEIADTITLLIDGRLAGQGEPQLFYTRPPSLAAARFFGATNEITGCVAAGEFTSDDRTIHQPTPLPDGRAVLIIRPEALRLQATSGPGTLGGTTVAARFAGTHLVLDVALDTGRILRVHQPIDQPVRLGSPTHLRIAATEGSIFAEPGDE
ncbi:ABC transporter ATP-binding protein [Kribbella qitaiheensis]|uniref:ABC-type quaternary amine transporter n=1 Tax=Kribbella qitaiheensis TaxID=1544730 RepID=A0A7G6WW85_9ACTN|nr:ABC transporter ATP-binding protein [Kribbella qitaiheensis]QNE18250.1 ABC transporter ATP-binding protein [Kribbella qitaiheensis]